MERLRTRLRPGSLGRAVATLMGGTIGAQIITVAVLPLLTRIYTPNDFSVLAVYISILAIFSSIACLRFEIAIPVPSSDRAGAILFLLAVTSVVAVTLFLGLSVFLVGERLALKLGLEDIVPYLWVIPVGVLGTGMYEALQYWSTRKHDFSSIAQTRIRRSFIGAGVQVSAGFAKAGAFGLILGQVIMQAGGFIYLIRQNYYLIANALRGVSSADILKVFKDYKNYPKLSTLETLLNKVGHQLPVILIAAIAMNAEAGYLLLASKLMVLPMSIFGKSIAQVYISRAAEHMSKGRMKEFTLTVMSKLFSYGVPLLTFGILVSPIFVPLIFGEAWSRVGELLVWMLPWFILQFITSPVSVLLNITNRQKVAVLLQVWGAIIRVLPLVVIWFLDLPGTVEAYAVACFFYYLLYLIVLLRAIGARFSEVIARSRFGMLGLVLAVSAAGCFNFLSSVI